MQPYFLPFLGYFSLIKHTDRFILFDVVQFKRRGWIERNRILKPEEGWQYIKVPLKKQPLNTLIKDMVVNNHTDWKSKIFSQLEHYKKNAPFYKETIHIIEKAFTNDVSISVLNKHILHVICDYLGFNREFELFSLMGLEIEQPQAPDEWALNICKSLGNITEYWNSPGGVNFFNRAKYNNNSIDLKFHEVVLSEYNQKRENFEAGLSIVDVLMYNSKDKTNEILDDYRLF